jgi:hypothetical protein
VRLEDFDKNPRFLNQADARRDADAFRADAIGEGDDFLHARQFAVIDAFDLRRRAGDDGVLVPAAITPGDFADRFAIRPFGQAEIRETLVVAVAVEQAAIRAGDVLVFLA